MTANDPDTDSNGLVTYRLEPLPSENHTAIPDMFTIDGESGWITTVRGADCEVTRVYRFSVVATDHGSQVKLSSSVLVEVTVTDENDNQPHFLDDIYHGSVLENVTPGEVVLTMNTSDADVTLENRLVTCYITGEQLVCSKYVNSVNVFLLCAHTINVLLKLSTGLSIPWCEIFPQWKGKKKNNQNILKEG